LIQRVLEVFWDQAARKKIKLTQEVAPGLPKLAGDLDRLQQLFINLVDNAIKYTPLEGVVSLTVTQTAVHNGGAPHIEIAVRDYRPGHSGKGLATHHGAFLSRRQARSRDLGGTGLGLAIVKHIVQATRASYPSKAC